MADIPFSCERMSAQIDAFDTEALSQIKALLAIPFHYFLASDWAFNIKNVSYL